MRLPGPQRDTYSSKVREFYSRGTSRRQKLLKVATLLVVTLLVLGVVSLFVLKEDKKPEIYAPKQSSDSAIEQLKGSDVVEDMRSLTSVYDQVDKDAEAVEVAKKLAQKTGETMDYMNLLNTCAVNNVPNKQACLDEVAAKLKPQLSKLSFYNVYTAGSSFDQGGDKKNAVTFYQRAYDIYDPKRADEYTKTKEQLKQRIDELSK